MQANKKASYRANHRTSDRETTYQSSHYYRNSQPSSEIEKADQAEMPPSKEKMIDVFEFEPVGFMSHGRW